MQSFNGGVFLCNKKWNSIYITTRCLRTQHSRERRWPLKKPSCAGQGHLHGSKGGSFICSAMGGWIGGACARTLLEDMAKWGAEASEVERTFVKLFVLAYAFLLRLPSEALPVVAGVKGMVFEANSMLYMSDGKLVLQLKRRKNKLYGSTLVRECWCASSRWTCPVHVVGSWVSRCDVGTRLFGDVTAAKALSTLRRILGLLGVPNSCEYRTQDFRRGHAQDLAESGGAVSVVRSLHGNLVL